jgi:hypothetical protein
MPARKPKLPAPLAKNAAKKKAAGKATLLAKASADLALIAQKKEEIADAFYEIGEALVRLREPTIVEALGHASFADLCEARLEISLARADRLIAIATRVRREDALRWGQEKATAILEITNATAADDTPREVAAGTLKLPGGKKLDVDKASARTLTELAKTLRQKRGKGSVRGRTTTREERKLASDLQKRLVAEGLEASVVAVATKPGTTSKLRIEVPADALAVLRAALRKA